MAPVRSYTNWNYRKTEGARDISFPRKLIAFAEEQKDNPEIAFDRERDKMIIVFDADIFESKV